MEWRKGRYSSPNTADDRIEKHVIEKIMNNLNLSGMGIKASDRKTIKQRVESSIGKDVDMK